MDGLYKLFQENKVDSLIRRQDDNEGITESWPGDNVCENKRIQVPECQLVKDDLETRQRLIDLSKHI